MYFLYNLLWLLLIPVLVVFFVQKKLAKEPFHLAWRLGIYASDFLDFKTNQRIWIHAASVGEINAICAFVKLLREEYPKAWIGISTMTPTGLKTAQTKIPEADQHFIIPLDLFWTARRALRQIQPRLLITMETEIWPNLLKYAKRFEIVVVMINGRISARKIDLYLKLKGFFKKILTAYAAFSMILPIDAERIIAMGADPTKVSINGNLKFDSLAYHVEMDLPQKMLSTLRLSGNEPIWVAGSTREGEEEFILEAFKMLRIEFPELKLIIAPRHIQRSQEIVGTVKQYGFQPLLRTEINDQSFINSETIVILNTMGELFSTYAIATVVFCGASLVPLGGQNPLEAAVWGKVVLYGPSMEDFLDAKKLLEDVGAGIEVNNSADLAQKITNLLNESSKREKLGELGKNAVISQSGSAIRNLEIVKKVIVH